MPVPDSPWIRMVDLVSATLATISRILAILGEAVMMEEKSYLSPSSLFSRRFSSMIRHCSKAFSTTIRIWSSLKGLET